MTDERLAEIMGLTADVVAGRIHVRFDEETAWLAILDLRREMERLRAREAAMREIVEAVAHGDMTSAQEDFGTTPICVFGCGGHEDPDAIGKFIHTAECQWTKARALLGLETE